MAGESIETILAEIGAIAGDRSQVLVEVAAVGVGAWSARPALPATELLVAGLLLEAAGANDLDELSRWVQLGRDRALQRPYAMPSVIDAIDGPPISNG